MKTENKFGVSGFGVSGKELADKSRRKWELLEHYSEREPVKFIQIDDFCDPEMWDEVIRPDEDGHAITGQVTYELMTGYCNIRLLIRPDTSIENILGFLKRMTQRLSEKDFIKFYHGLVAQKESGWLYVHPGIKNCDFCGCGYEENRLATITTNDKEFFVCKPCLKSLFQQRSQQQSLYL